MPTLTARDHKLVSLLENKRYQVDYYQREYRWQDKHMQALLEDLTARFEREYTEGDSLEAIENYASYFLGTIVVSERGAERFIIDGQQRLTSLTLLLIYLRRHLIAQGATGPNLDPMIFSDHYGQPRFNLDVPDRSAVLHALFKEGPVPLETKESVTNLLDRFEDITRHFPLEEYLERGCLGHFAYWMRNQVVLVEISTTSEDEAYSIFETMNDRGLSLTPLEMLKSYLLTHVHPKDRRDAAARRWRETIEALLEFGKDTDTEFVKAWLRAQYAQNIRERKKGSEPQDFDLIGSAFHQWVRTATKQLGLVADGGFEAFLDAFHFHAHWYCRILRAMKALEPGLESIYFNARNEFSQQPMVLLAPLVLGDDDATVRIKLRLTADYLDSHILSRFVNGKTINYNSVQYAMFNIVRAIRGKDLESLAAELRQRLETLAERLERVQFWQLSSSNRKAVQHFLARLAHHVQQNAGESSAVGDYLNHALDAHTKAYEIEHIVPDRFGVYSSLFFDELSFQQVRSGIGNLTLLQRGVNQSAGGKDFAEKRNAYGSSPLLLTRSLTPEAYTHHPTFQTYLNASAHPFQPYESFGPREVAERAALYTRLAQAIWGPERLHV